VLLDIEMPVMNGLETVARIKRASEVKGKKIPVYAITAYHPDILNDEADVSKFDGIISKPFTQEKIQKIIDSVAQ
jgi:CheY-like chemotaxis protein